MDNHEDEPVAPATEAEPKPAPGGTHLSRGVLERVQRRDPQALALFYDFYVDRVYALAYRLLGDRAQAEDVTQEVFQKVYRAASQLDAGRDPAPWLWTIAHNACRDLWRSKSHKLARRSRSLDDVDAGLRETLRAPDLDPEEAAIRGERQRRVERAVRALPDNLREVVVLHDYQGLGHEAIASMLGASHDAVRKRYSRALARLAETLKDLL